MFFSVDKIEYDLRGQAIAGDIPVGIPRFVKPAGNGSLYKNIQQINMVDVKSSQFLPATTVGKIEVNIRRGHGKSGNPVAYLSIFSLIAYMMIPDETIRMNPVPLLPIHFFHDT